LSRPHRGYELLFYENFYSVTSLTVSSLEFQWYDPCCCTFLLPVLNGRKNSFGFALEFHLPYYALRRSPAPQEDARGLRRCGSFIPSRENPNAFDYIYEAQVSILITGVDEWFRTADCCTDIHFGSEETVLYYYEYDLDAPTGGEKSTNYPIWNPREYFLLVLSCRVRQITKEWSNIMDALEDRLQYHVKHICKSGTLDHC